MRLQLQTWTEVERYLETSTTAIMPIGSTEQHGPNGLIGTDTVTPEEIAYAVGEATNLMVVPTISVGMAQHHMAFTGSMTLRPSTMISVIGDYVNSLAHHGFDRFYFINGHGGNSATIEAAFQEIYTDHTMTNTGNEPSVRCQLRNWWTGPGMRSLDQGAVWRQGRHARHDFRGCRDPIPVPRHHQGCGNGTRQRLVRPLDRRGGLPRQIPRRADRLTARSGHPGDGTSKS